jgi:hypothetical protein
MYSRDSYLEIFNQMDEILSDGLEKSPGNKKLLDMIRINNNMFLYTTFMINKHDSLELENRMLYNKLHDAQFQIEKYKLEQMRK